MSENGMSLFELLGRKANIRVSEGCIHRTDSIELTPITDPVIENFIMATVDFEGSNAIISGVDGKNRLVDIPVCCIIDVDFVTMERELASV